MCWSPEASAAMVVAGGAATAVARRQGQPAAIWITLGYFTVMEALQLAGYAVLDECGTPANRNITLLSYLHIVFQPFFINAFAMELVPPTVKRRVRAWVFGLCAVSAIVMLTQLLPIPGLGLCKPGTPLCGDAFCTVSGNWHIAWDIPYNGLMVPLEAALGSETGLPTYAAAVFLVPLAYGAWRFVVLNCVAGPVLAWQLTDNPNEMPAIWCLFSIFILLIALSPPVRQTFSSRSWWGVTV